MLPVVTVSCIALILSIIIVTSISHTQGFAFAATQDSNLWYVGKAAKQNMYVKYLVQDNATNNGYAYEMTIYFRDYDPVNKYWTSSVFVAYNGHAINGTFHLNDDGTLYVLDNSTIPAEMEPYRNSYFHTIDWIGWGMFKPGKSLDYPSWQIRPDGPPLRLSNMENTFVPAGTFNSTLLTVKQTKIWINKDLPYPVKEILISDWAIPNPPLWASVELLEVGEGYPKTVSEVPIKILSPLKQFKSVSAQYVICKTGFALILKSVDSSPACVKPTTADKLLMSGWAKGTGYQQ